MIPRSPRTLRSDSIERGNHLSHSPANVVGEIQNVVKRPVQVIGQKSDLLPEAIGSDRRYSPGAPPPTSTRTVSLQLGQVTSANVEPSVLTRRYRSCRNARSVAHNPPMT